MLLDLGNPEALEWITNCIHKRLTEADIDTFRSDFNMSPLDHWRQNDPRDRQGILENHWCTGYLAFWDELLRRNPNLLIDSCASGGKRNDLETMRRSIILWRSDRAGGAYESQCQTYGISFWLPYHGSHGGQPDPYVFRSCMYPAIVTSYNKEKEFDYNLIRRLFGQWRQIAPNYFGDYYPLTPYSLAKTNVWMAWQFDVPESGEGMVQAFRRPGNDSVASQRFKLRGLSPDTKYELTDFDDQVKTRISGRELMEKGLEVHINDQPGAKVIKYKAESLSKWQAQYNLPETDLQTNIRPGSMEGNT